MSVLKTINAGIRASGVIWRACSRCETEWPFPVGAPPSIVVREFVCAVCSSADAARTQREPRG